MHEEVLCVVAAEILFYVIVFLIAYMIARIILKIMRGY